MHICNVFALYPLPSLRVDPKKWENIAVRIESLDIDETDDVLFIRAGKFKLS